MSKAVITAKNVIDLLEQVIAEEPEGTTHKYQWVRIVGNPSACYYATQEGKGDCIVGRVLEKAVPEEFAKLAKFERADGANPAGIFDPEEMEADFDWSTVSPKAQRILRAAQNAQDDGSNWGFALHSAKAEAEALRKLNIKA